MSKKLSLLSIIFACLFFQASCEKEKVFNSYIEGEFQYV